MEQEPNRKGPFGALVSSAGSGLLAVVSGIGTFEAIEHPENYAEVAFVIGPVGTVALAALAGQQAREFIREIRRGGQH
jgi:hypothetical protein